MWHERCTNSYRVRKTMTSVLGGAGDFVEVTIEQNKQEFARQRTFAMIFQTEEIASAKAGRNENIHQLREK